MERMAMMCHAWRDGASGDWEQLRAGDVPPGAVARIAVQRAALAAFTGCPEELVGNAEWAATGIPVVRSGPDGVREVCARVRTTPGAYW